MSVGRAADNDIVVADVLASRHHATIVPTDGVMEIRDAGTINGTFVNGVRIEAAPLHEGDVVTIGNLDLVFTGGHAWLAATRPRRRPAPAACRSRVRP